MKNGLRRVSVLFRVASLVLSPAHGIAQSASAQDVAPPVGFILPTLVALPAAAFRRGDVGIIVLGGQVSVTSDALKAEAGFSGATIIDLPQATEITVPLAADQVLNVTPASSGWLIGLGTPSAVQPPLQVVPGDHVLNFTLPTGAASPAPMSLSIADPLTGQTMLIGAVAAGASAYGQSGPGFELLPTWLGAAVLPVSDDLSLAATPSGLILQSGSAVHPLSLAPVPRALAIERAAGLSRAVSLPQQDLCGLRSLMESQEARVASLPPLGRLDASLDLARTMLALGFGQEANAVLADALAADPAASGNQQLLMLNAMAETLARAPGAAAAFANPDLPATDETRLWQGIGLANAHHPHQAAPKLVAGLPILITYPAPLQRAIGPPIAETLIAADALAPVGRLLAAHSGDPAFALAQAEALQAAGYPHQAIASYDKIWRLGDQRQAGIAKIRSILLRHQLGQIDAAQAAASIDKHLYDWRGPRHEWNTRLALANLRAEAGDWPHALSNLQAVDRLFPARHNEILADRTAMFARMINGPALDHMGPLAAIAVIERNGDLIPQGAAGLHVIKLLAKELIALDLPGEAAPVLQKLLDATPPGQSRAAIGLALARVDQDSGNENGAAAALTKSDAPSLPADLAEQRALLAARIQAAQGHPQQAQESLAPLQSAQAWDAKADLAEAHQDWQAAETDLKQLAQSQIPPSGAIPPSGSAVLLKLAGAASHSGDQAELSALAGTYAARLGNDPDAMLFRTLTDAPLGASGSLDQALHQIAAIERVPSELDPKPPNQGKH
ncbi:MAG: hypothetical protein B7Z78_09765 [Rhodospirillales bacterium 20-60-12]|nr:MAG: hypothetical protein B7Z78_09765 [Rhodospirillales bacterium 20-60-12]